MRMVKYIILLLISCTCYCINATAQKPNVFVLDANALLANKNKVKANDAALFPAYKELIKDADKALQRRSDFISLIVAGLRKSGWPRSATPKMLLKFKSLLTTPSWSCQTLQRGACASPLLFTLLRSATRYC